ncbi:hypothetical protein KI688_005906 [Linnemannia hyalina]|uniref:Uncharacterized protein n=1 Tax=Linnemannia hyalina TaxID=64524 RepID=A0A9P8BXT8_9FUNG|nr:hypothetical protein KI688_005906 [Linnemannia hyalina]
MRFSTLIAASTMTALSVVSAQSSVPDPKVVAACSTCIDNAAIAAAPACKSLEGYIGGKNAPPADKMQACMCGLKGNMNWADSCVRPDKCTALHTSALVSAVTSNTSQPNACINASATSAGFKMCGVSSAKVAAAGAAMAVVGALL